VSPTARRFVDRFEAERARLAGAMEGGADAAERERYAGLLLHRLMFLYFLQAKGLVAADPDYLRNALRRAQARRAAGERVSYFRQFLLPIFHDELAGGACAGEAERLRAAIARLGGGLFEVHPLEGGRQGLTIADEAFARIFDWFDAYRWRLDDGSPRGVDEVTPDVFDQTFARTPRPRS